MSRFNGNYIEHPEAYRTAIQNRIKQNAWTRRDRELREAAPEVHAWLLSYGYVDSGAPVYDDDLQDYRQPREKHPAGFPPKFLLDAREKWGGLTEGQLAFARKALTERATQNAERAAKWAAEKANAPAWTPGRQTIVGTLVKCDYRESDFGSGAWKGLVKLADGRTLWSTIPAVSDEAQNQHVGDVIEFAVKIEPKPEDPTFAFGSRPTKAKLISRKPAPEVSA